MSVSATLEPRSMSGIHQINVQLRGSKGRNNFSGLEGECKVLHSGVKRYCKVLRMRKESFWFGLKAKERSCIVNGTPTEEN